VREITSHKVNGLNEALKIIVVDEPGSGGACHKYQILSTADQSGTKYLSAMPPCDIEFQNGPILESGVNGISNEALLAIVRDRLEGFQSGPFACDVNGEALHCVIGAMVRLQNRTTERTARGVEGTAAK
jgi:hypothetical protein